MRKRLRDLWEKPEHNFEPKDSREKYEYLRRNNCRSQNTTVSYKINQVQRFWRFSSLLLKCVERSVCWTSNSRFIFLLQCSFETHFGVINVQPVTLEMRSETSTDLHANCPSLSRGSQLLKCGQTDIRTERNTE
jgi:hypothetical protein